MAHFGFVNDHKKFYRCRATQHRSNSSSSSQYTATLKRWLRFACVPQLKIVSTCENSMCNGGDCGAMFVIFGETQILGGRVYSRPGHIRATCMEGMRKYAFHNVTSVRRNRKMKASVCEWATLLWPSICHGRWKAVRFIYSVGRRKTCITLGHRWWKNLIEHSLDSHWPDYGKR